MSRLRLLGFTKGSSDDGVPLGTTAAAAGTVTRRSRATGFGGAATTDGALAAAAAGAGAGADAGAATTLGAAGGALSGVTSSAREQGEPWKLIVPSACRQRKVSVWALALPRVPNVMRANSQALPWLFIGSLRSSSFE